MTQDPRWGGQGLPGGFSLAFSEMLVSGNMAWKMYSGLTESAALTLEAHGTEELKQRFIPKMVSGEWAGTMCLTEAHSGSDLGILRTRAEPRADGSFAITGTKVFISAGEHDLTNNIIHLVLARLPDAPPGTKGISLFLVPKFLPDAAGNAGAPNGSCGSIEHKMGIRTTCVMHYDSIGLAAAASLSCMFTKTMRAWVRTQDRSVGTSLAGVDRLRERSVAGPLPHGCQGAREGRRPDHRAPGRAPHAAHAEGVRRGRSHPVLPDGA
jgi:hypothetical protein